MDADDIAKMLSTLLTLTVSRYSQESIVRGSVVIDGYSVTFDSDSLHHAVPNDAQWLERSALSHPKVK